MPRVYTRGVDAYHNLPLSVYLNFPIPIIQKKTSVHVFLIKIGQAMDFLPSQRLIASHPQQDDCKSTKKNWDLQENRKVSCKSQ